MNVFDCAECLHGAPLGWGELVIIAAVAAVVIFDWLPEGWQAAIKERFRRWWGG